MTSKHHGSYGRTPYKHNSYERLDELFKARAVKALSLNPEQTFATSFVKLEGSVVRPLAPELSAVFGLMLEDIVQSVLANFPENIFWDFDFLVANMLEQTLSAADPAAFLAQFAENLIGLMKLFGNDSSINFRYLHDFLYGFDWAKWVQKASATRRLHGPFSLVFLDYLTNRGQELLVLIAEDDPKYHRLRGETYRNPFFFSREPEEEAQLLSELSTQHFIPVATWSKDALPIWDKPFYRRREQLASELDLSAAI